MLYVFTIIIIAEIFSFYDTFNDKHVKIMCQRGWAEKCIWKFIKIMFSFSSTFITDSSIQMHMEKLWIDFCNRSSGEITCSQCASWVSGSTFIYFFLLLRGYVYECVSHFMINVIRHLSATLNFLTQWFASWRMKLQFFLLQLKTDGKNNVN